MSFAEADRAIPSQPIRYNRTQNLRQIQSTSQERFEASGPASHVAPLRVIQKERVSRAAEAARKLYLSSQEDGSASKVASLRSMQRKNQTHNCEVQLTGQEISEDAGPASQVSISVTDLAPGDPIFVLWEDGLWYPATCISINQRRVEYEWLDPAGYAETGRADTSKVRPRIVGSFKTPVGTRILVKWKEDNNWFPAKFLGKRGNHVDFEWESPGDFEATGTVESSHVRLMVNEAQNVKLTPMLLPGEDAVRRFTKDISTSCSKESTSSSLRSSPTVISCIFIIMKFFKKKRNSKSHLHQYCSSFFTFQFVLL
jgi:hypothetical protein